MPSWVDRLEVVTRPWNAVQVELQGRYSLPRLHEVVAHAKTSRRLTNWLTVVATPFPPLALVVLTDALPQRSPHLGLWDQTAWVVGRLSFLCWFAAFVFAQQVHVSSPTLPLSATRLWVVSVAVGVVAVLPFCAIGSVWFPVPLGVEVALFPWLATFGGCFWVFWKVPLRADAVASANLRRYSRMLLCQTSIISTYVAYSIAFAAAGANYQTYVSFLLPILKLAFKNFAHRGLLHMEDLAPSMIVFNIDVFHAVFVCTSTQQAVTRSTTVVIMLVDVVQSIMAYGEVYRIVRHVTALADQCQRIASVEMDHHGASAATDAVDHDKSLRTSTLKERVRSKLQPKFCVVEYALELVNNHPRFRNHPDVVLPRHLRCAPLNHYEVSTPQPSAQAVPMTGSASAKIAPTEALITDAKPPQVRGEPAGAASSELSEVERMQLDCITSVLKMLHMIEFYVLIEFAEAVVAVVYTLYVRAMSRLPNRVYFPQFRNLSEADFDTTVNNMATYAALELASFVLFCVVVDRQLQRMSAVQQLAFVVQKHWRLGQVALAWWIWVVLNLRFEHFGMDFTFQFAWLSKTGSALDTPTPAT